MRRAYRPVTSVPESFRSACASLSYHYPPEAGAGNRRYAQDGENEARMNDVRSEGTVNRLPSRSLSSAHSIPTPFGRDERRRK